MNRGYECCGGSAGGRRWAVGPPALPMEWREEWFANLLLTIVLAVLTFLMLLSIYLVITKPEPSSLPEKKTVPSQVNAFAVGDPIVPRCALAPPLFRPREKAIDMIAGNLPAIGPETSSRGG